MIGLGSDKKDRVPYSRFFMTEKVLLTKMEFAEKHLLCYNNSKNNNRSQDNDNGASKIIR